ncbi:MAG: hypothetical protein SH857_05120 [Chitinophagales bacterium]|nr:hypothetical protein [Chitinophagales bacterium]
MKSLRIGAYIILVLLFQEAVLRFLFPVPEIKNFNRINYIQLASAEQGKPVRNMFLSSISLPDTAAEFIETLNNYGFRDRNWKMQKQPGKKRILLVGDSFAEGILAEDAETVSASFQRDADKAEVEIDLMNMGIASGNLNTYAKLIVDALPLFQPDYILLLTYANDNYYFKPFNTLAPIKPEFNNKLKPRLWELIEILQRDEMLPFRFPIKKSYFITTDLINKQLNDAPDGERTLREEVTPHIADAIRSGKFDPGNVDIIYRKEERFRQLINISNELAFLKSYCSKYGVELFVAHLPSRSQVTNYYYTFQKESCRSCPDSMDLTGETYKQLVNALSHNCQELKIPFLDLSPLVWEEEKRGNHLYWNYDVHMRGKGYVWTGEKLFSWYKEQLRLNRSNLK